METKFIDNQNITKDVRKSKNKSFFEKAKEHKKKIVIGTAIVVTGTFLVINNRAVIKSSIKSLLVEEDLTKSKEMKSNESPLVSESFEKSIASKFPIDNKIIVREHIRNLSEGRSPSINKVELASKHGYSLEEHQTWVNGYTKASA